MTNEAAKVIECPCGVMLRGSSDDETVANAQRHAQGQPRHDAREQAIGLNRVSPIVRE